MHGRETSCRSVNDGTVATSTMSRIAAVPGWIGRWAGFHGTFSIAMIIIFT